MNDLGPQPDASIEPGEPAPGGPDAVPESADGVDGEAAEETPAGRDLDPDKNPTTEVLLPDEAKTGEDTDTAATKGEDAPKDESPA